MSHNYYKILKVKKTASLKQIKSSYRLLAKKYHPDLNPNNKKSHELFIDLEKAYSTLSDPILRKSYDKTLKPLKRNAYKNYKDKYKQHCRQRNSGISRSHSLRPCLCSRRHLWNFRLRGAAQARELAFGEAWAHPARLGTGYSFQMDQLIVEFVQILLKNLPKLLFQLVF